MSKRKDRERAESGIIHRNGKLVSRKEWENRFNPPKKEEVKNA